MATTRAEQKAATRRRILEIAADLFAEDGYEGATTRQIAQRCGVSIGTVFAHFPSKQELLQAVLYDGVERALARARLKLDAAVGVEEAMAVFASSLYRFYLDRRDLSRELLRHSLFTAGEFADQLIRFRQELMTYMPQPVADDPGSEVIGDTLLSHYFFVLLMLLNEEDMSVRRAVDHLRRMNALVLPRQRDP